MFELRQRSIHTAELIVQAHAGKTFGVFVRDRNIGTICARRTRGNTGIDRSKVHIKVFAPHGPVIGEGPLQTAAYCPAQNPRVVADGRD